MELKKNQPLKQTNKKGFTLVEMLLVLSLMSFVITFAVPIYRSFQQRNTLRYTTELIASQIRTAQLNSQAAIEDDTWGIRFNPGQIVVFKGNDFVSRDVDFDLITNISPQIILNGVTEITFAKFSGDISSSQTLDVILEGNLLQIQVNEKGIINF